MNNEDKLVGADAAVVDTARSAEAANQLTHADPVTFLSLWFRRRPKTLDREDCLRALGDIATTIDQLSRQNEHSQRVFNELLDRDDRYTKLIENISRLIGGAIGSVPSAAQENETHEPKEREP